MDIKKIKEVEKRVIKLKKIEDELIHFVGFSISITKLTVIKYLCKDSVAMVGFACFISNKVNNRIKYLENDISLKVPINESLRLMNKITDDFAKNNTSSIEKETLIKLETLRNEIKNYQNKIKTKKWTNIRIIKNLDILIIEEAISCFIFRDSPEMGYKLAKSYVEKYDPAFGSGLIPASLKYLIEINKYWVSYLNKINTNGMLSTKNHV